MFDEESPLLEFELVVELLLEDGADCPLLEPPFPDPLLELDVELVLLLDDELLLELEEELLLLLDDELLLVLEEELELPPAPFTLSNSS